MKKATRLRKPKPLIAAVYAGVEQIEINGERAVAYVGGVNLYNGAQQLHLTPQDVHHLAHWLTRASAYLKQQERKK